MSEPDVISIRGASEHNLKSVSLDVPKKALVVFSGVSGSGKSSLAFDTLYAEGQRRYVESLSAYARQFLGQMEKPKYETLRGLSPTISIEQKAASNNPRSTVGTVTEVHDYLRVLYASIGVQHCWNCGRKVGKQSAQQIIDEILKLPSGTKLMLLAPLVQNRKGEHRDLLADAQIFPRPDRRKGQGARGAHRAGQEIQARHRADHRSAGAQARRPQPTHRLGRDGAEGRQGSSRRHRRVRLEERRPRPERAELLPL